MKKPHSGCSSLFFCAAWHSQSPDYHQCQRVAHTQRGFLSGAHWWDETGWLLPWSEVEWKTNVMEGDRERLCLISLANVSDGSYLPPPALRLFIILRWQGGAGKRRGLGAPSWSITLEVSLPSYLTATWITAALVYRHQPIWMSSRRRKRFLCTLYQSRWVIGWMECAASFSLHIHIRNQTWDVHKHTDAYTHSNQPIWTQQTVLVCTYKHTQTHAFTS